MEALTAVQVGLLAIYDMAKAWIPPWRWAVCACSPNKGAAVGIGAIPVRHCCSLFPSATSPMPALPSVSEWLPSGAIIGFGLFLFMVLRGDMKAMETRLRGDMKAMEERQREDMRELRSDLKALGEKVDRLVESVLVARQS